MQVHYKMHCVYMMIIIIIHNMYTCETEGRRSTTRRTTAVTFRPYSNRYNKLFSRLATGRGRKKKKYERRAI